MAQIAKPEVERTELGTALLISLIKPIRQYYA